MLSCRTLWTWELALKFGFWMLVLNKSSFCQATCGIPEVAFATFENMEYGGEGMATFEPILCYGLLSFSY